MKKIKICYKPLIGTMLSTFSMQFICKDYFSIVITFIILLPTVTDGLCVACVDRQVAWCKLLLKQRSPGMYYE